MEALHYPAPTKRKIEPLTPVEAYERACGLMKRDYQTFGEVEARRVIAGLLAAIDALTTEVQANAMRQE